MRTSWPIAASAALPGCCRCAPGLHRPPCSTTFTWPFDEAGYETRVLDEDVLFSGQGIEQGKVGFADTLDQGPLLQIDVTLENP